MLALVARTTKRWRAAARIGSPILVFLVAWELLGRANLVHVSLFPPPSRVWMALLEMYQSGELIRDIRVSLWRALVGWLIGSVLGAAVGVITGRIETVRAAIAPIIHLFRPLPPVAIIPLIIIWFGIGEVSKIFSIAFAVFFPVWINAHVGSQRVPKSFLWTARTLKASRATVLAKVIFPGALPFIVAGLRTGIAVAFVMVFVSELAGASAGVGYQISVSHLAYRVDRMMGALVVLGILGAAADVVMTKSIGRIFPWLRFADQK